MDLKIKLIHKEMQKIISSHTYDILISTYFKSLRFFKLDYMIKIDSDREFTLMSSFSIIKKLISKR